MEKGIGARAFGMGCAYTALAEDVTAIYWNPAGLVNLKSFQLHGMHSERFSGLINWDFCGAAVFINERTALGVGYFRLGVDGIPLTTLIDPSHDLGDIFTDKSGNRIRNRPYVYKYVNDCETAFLFSFARKSSENFSYGGSIKIINKSIGDYDAWGLGFDIGILYRPILPLKLGFVLSDVTSTLVAWDTGTKEVILPNIRIGGVYSLEFSFLKLMPAVDLNINFENREDAQLKVDILGIYLHTGLEARLYDSIAFRLGSDAGYFTAGTGIRLSSYNIDYGFSHHTNLGNTHRVSLTYLLKQ